MSAKRQKSNKSPKSLLKRVGIFVSSFFVIVISVVAVFLFLFVSPGQRRAILEAIGPGARAYATPTSIVGMEQSTQLRTAFRAVDHLVSIRDADNNAYIAIVSTDVVAGYDFRNMHAQRAVWEGIDFPEPTILPTGSERTPTVVRNDTRLDFDRHIRPLRQAISAHARDVALDRGILQAAVDNAAEWYENMVRRSVESVSEEIIDQEMGQQDWTRRIATPTPIFFESTHFPITLRVDPAFEGKNFTVEDTRGQPYALWVKNNEVEVRVTVDDGALLDMKQLYEYVVDEFMINEVENPAQSVARIFDPANIETGGVIVVNYGSDRIYTYSIFEDYIVSSVVIANSSAVASRVFGDAIYAMQRVFLSTPRVDGEDFIQSVRYKREIERVWNSRNWNAAIDMRENIRQSGMTAKADMLDTMRGESTVRLPPSHQRIAALYEYIRMLDRDSARLGQREQREQVERWLTGIRALRGQYRWNSEDLSTIYLHLIENYPWALSPSERSDAFGVLINSYGLNPLLWSLATQDERKRLFLNEYEQNRQDSGSRGLQMWHTRRGNTFQPVRLQSLLSAQGPVFWWSIDLVTEINSDQRVSVTEQDIRRAIQNHTAESGQSIPIDEGVTLVLPSDRIRQAVNVVIFAQNEVYRVEVITRVFGGLQIVTHGPFLLENISMGVLGLSRDNNELSNLINRIGQSFSERRQVTRNLRERIEDQLVHEYNQEFPMPKSVGFR